MKTFLKNHLFLFICMSMLEKKTRIENEKHEGMLHISLVLQHSFATWWLNMALNECCFVLSSFFYLFLLKRCSFYGPVVTDTDHYMNSQCENQLGCVVFFSLVIRTDSTTKNKRKIVGTS